MGIQVGTKVDLAGRHVVVSGASSGIGAEVCRAVVASGGSVAMFARREPLLRELEQELGARAAAVPVDVTDLDALSAAVDHAAEELGAIDAVVAAAGQSMIGSLATGTPERWRELIELNLTAPLSLVRFASEHFPPAGRRDVVLIGSSIALTPFSGTGIYSASKRGLRAAFDVLRLELAPLGINVSHVMPGFFATEVAGGSGTVFDGEMPALDIPLFTEGGGPADPAVLGETIAYMLGLPDGVCINELVMRPTTQLNP
jgi:NADP-dependent 3-hydroxy acid dehydrogenase YdfG